MLKSGKYVKYIAFAFVFIFSLVIFSNVDAATFNVSGTPTQYGWHSGTPEDGTTVEKNTGAVVYYPATIGGNKAFCMQWSKPAPSNGASMTQSGTLDAKYAALIYEGLYVGSYSPQAIQLAIYYAAGTTNSNLPNVFDNVTASKYHKSSFTAMSSSQLASYKAEAKQLISQVNARGYKSNFFNGSSSAQINLTQGSNFGKETVGDYIYVGPLDVSTTSGNPITFTLANSAFGLVSSVGGTTFLKQIPASGASVYLKVPASYGSGECKVTFYTSINSINGYVYSAGSSYQNFAVITNETTKIEKSATFKWKISLKLTINKTDSKTGANLSGAQFSLYNSSNQLVDTKTTDSNGQITFSGLEPGRYTVRETQAPSGYKIVSESKTITLSTKNETLSFTNDEIKKTITVVKQDIESSTPLAGAVIGLYNSNKVLIDTKTTDSNGRVTFSNLEPGKYYVKEEKAPNGYVITDTNFIDADVSSISKVVTFKDKKPKGRISITKYVEYATSRQLVGTSDATFGIYNVSTGGQVGQITTNSNGIATSDYLPMGNYYLKEIALNTSYMKNNTRTIQFSIDETANNNTINLGEFVNEGLMGELQIYKYYTEDGASHPLQGAVFEIYSSNGNLIDTVTTNAAGYAYVKDLEDGEYTYKEISVPNGYQLDGSTRSFSISKTNKQVKVSVENQVKYGTLNIIKISNDGKEVPLKDVVFDVYASNKTTKVATLKTDANGRASTKLKYGTYYLKEVSAPINVILKNIEQKIVIGETEGAKLVYDLDIKNDLISHGIKLYKVDDENKPISGVRFALYSDAEGKNQLATATTDSSGLAVFDKLDVGTYYYKELAAPDGYITTKISEMKPIVLTDANPVYTETIENKLIMGQVRIHKIDEEDNAVEGAEFDIKDSNGTVVGHIVTGKDGIAQSAKLRKGNYTLIETKVPFGYIISKEAINFTINTNDEIVEKEIVNKFNRGIVKVKKVDTETKEFIDGAVFEIYQIQKDGTEKLVDTIRKYSNEGIGTSQELKNGKYYLIETVAPDGAVIDNTRYEFEVTDTEKEFSFTVENKIRKGKIALIKYDNYNEPVAGVEFQILAENKTTIIETLRTDEAGRATSKRLKLGTYYVKETSTPERYIPINDLIKCELKEDEQIITLQKEIANTRVPVGKIELIKTDDLGEYLEGVKFQLLSSDKKTVVEELTTDAQGKAISKEIRQGTYYIKETYAPEIYLPVTDLIKCEIKTDNQVITLQKEIVNRKIIGGLKVTKKDDGGNPVAGVKFTIYKEGSSSPVTTITTNDQGVALANDLILGKYYFVETSVPDNIYINSESVSFEIKTKGELIEKTVVNERVKGKLVITKTNSENGTAIEGVTFEIYDSNKNPIGIIYTDLDGIATTENLRDKEGNVIPLYAGTYYFAEIAAPTRFFFDTTMKQFNIVKGNETVNVSVENTPFKLPQTGGFISTDATIVLIVSIVSITGYVVGNILINRRRFW